MSPTQRSTFLARLKVVQKDDPLWLGILHLIDAARDQEMNSLCRPQIGDEEAHRGRGRMGMCIELREMLEDARVAAAEDEGPRGEA